MNKKIHALIILVFLIGTLLISTSALADPTINTDPLKPTPKGTVSFTVSIPDGEQAQDVVIYVEECEEELCFTDKFNESMNSLGANTYEATITLRHQTATYFKYRVGYNSPSGWVWYPEGDNNRINSDLDRSGIGNNGGNGGSNDTPGFETLLFIISIIFISFVAIQRRR